MAVHALVLLDTSCIIDPPVDLADLAEAACLSTLSVAELAFGLHHPDPVQAALRERRYRAVLRHFDPVPYSATAAHWYGALAASVRAAGRSPRPRRTDLLIASVAVDLAVPLVTRNPSDVAGLDRLLEVVSI